MENVAILLSTYNGAQYLNEQLDSIKNQTYTDWVLYIRDDGSSDGTQQIIHQYCKTDTRIKFINQKNQVNLGVKDSFWNLLKNSEADIYLFCDQDDFWKPNKVALSVEKVTRLGFETPALVFTNLTVTDENLKVVLDRQLPANILDTLSFEKMMTDNRVTGCTVAINHALKKIALNTDTNKIVMHDWWLALLAKCFGTMAYISEPTILYRQHGTNQVGTHQSLSARLKKSFDLEKLYQQFCLSVTQLEYLRKNYLTEDSLYAQAISNYLADVKHSRSFESFFKIFQRKYKKHTLLGTLSLNYFVFGNYRDHQRGRKSK